MLNTNTKRLLVKSPVLSGKKIYFLFLCLLLVHQSSDAQWTFTATAFTGIVRGLFFTDVNTGYAVGSLGALSKTTDGGITWTAQPSGVTTDLRGVHFVNDNLGYISGASGVVLKTTNGGATWALTNAGIDIATLRAVDFTSADTGFIGGSAGIIYVTINGGVTWNSISLGTGTDIIQLDMVNANVGYAVTCDPTFLNGYVFKTADGGHTWSQVYSNPNIGLLGLAVADANTIYAGGEAQTIVKTTDGGSTWDTVHSGIAGARIRSGFALSENVAYMVDDFGNAFGTTDGGITWNVTMFVNGLFSVYFPTTVGYTGDGLGNVFKYTPPCPLPANLSSGNITGTSAKLNWDAVPGAEGYKVRYKVSGSGEWTLKYSTGNAKTLNNLSPNTSYTWEVKTYCTINPGLSSDWSAKQKFTTGTLRIGDESAQQVSFQIYPNPAGDQTTIQFTLPQSSYVSIKVYDVSGREIACTGLGGETLLNGTLQQGEYSLPLNIDHFSKGVYIVKMISDSGIENQKLIVQ
jgi:photosystem II stability/assembly factor-like uncharacterized protein